LQVDDPADAFVAEISKEDSVLVSFGPAFKEAQVSWGGFHQPKDLRWNG
jgi:hypothetical protein